VLSVTMGRKERVTLKKREAGHKLAGGMPDDKLNGREEGSIWGGKKMVWGH